MFKPVGYSYVLITRIHKDTLLFAIFSGFIQNVLEFSGMLGNCWKCSGIIWNVLE